MKVGTKVKGLYLGEFEFTGIIADYRVIAVSPDAIQHNVILDTPINVYGVDKDCILVNTLWNGEACSYSRFTDNMEEINGYLR